MSIEAQSPIVDVDTGAFYNIFEVIQEQLFALLSIDIPPVYLRDKTP